MTHYGYARVSTKGQNLERQLIDMKNAGVAEENVYQDKASGKDFERLAYIQLVGDEEREGILQKGDCLVISSLDRLGRNYDAIQDQWRYITQDKEINIKVLDMPLLDTSGADGTLDRRFIADLTLQILSYVAAKERENIRARQQSSIDKLKSEGYYSGENHQGRQRKQISPTLFETLHNQYEAGELPVTAIAKKLKLTPNQVYRRFRERKYVVEELGKEYNPNHILGKYKPQSIA